MWGKMKMGSITKVVGTCIVLGFIMGFASGHVNLVKSGQILVNIVAPEDLHVSGIDIYQDNNNLIIEGKVENGFPYRNKEGGHVDFAVLAPDGTVIKKITTDYKFTAIGHRRGGSRRGLFEERTAIIPPGGSTVRLMFYD
jgi:hypothetical protein